MAKRLKAGEDPDAMSGSLTDKKATIMRVARGIIALEEQRKGIGTQITELRGELKSAGILQADFNAAMRLFKLEGDERALSLDGMRVCFEALAIGGQGELFPQAPADADGKAAKPAVQVEVKPGRGRAAKGSGGKNGKNADGKAATNLGDFKAQKDAAKEAGRQAYRDGKTPDDCPYEEEPLRIAWITGLDLEAEDTDAAARGGKGRSKGADLDKQQPAGTAD